MADPDEPVPPAPARPAGASLLTAGGVVLTIGGLYIGRDIFVPFAIAILLCFVLAPLVSRLRWLRLPKVVAVIVAVTIAFSVIGAISAVVAIQVVQLADNLPLYQQTISEKIRSLRSSASGEGGIVEKFQDSIEDLRENLSAEEDPARGSDAPASGREPTRAPIPVTIEPLQTQPLAIIQSIVGPLLAPLATAGVVVIFVIFILLERQDMRDRFIKLVGAADLQRTTEAIGVAASRVSRYLLMQLMVNVTYAIPIGIGLFFIGIPNAVLWAVLAAVLRFIPFLGPLLAAFFPAALAVAVDPGWSMLLWVIALIVTIELISNNLVEPWLYGASTGLSSFAIIIAAIFWTTLWGPVGLILSTPLTVCLVVIGRYVPRLEFLGVLLGSDPVLAPEERFYQRLMAGNIEESVEIAEDYVDERSSRAFYDEVAIPALRLAENDRHHASEMTSRRAVAVGATAVVREIAEHVRETGSVATADPHEAAFGAELAPAAVARRVLCIGGRTELDRAAAEMVAECLGERGIGVRVLSPIAVSQDAMGQLDLDGIEIVCLSYLHPRPQVFARYVCRRLRRRGPHLKLVVGFWNASPDVVQSEDLAAQMGADAVAFSLGAMEERIGGWLASSDTHPTASTEETAIPENEQVRLDALRELGLTSGQGEHFDALASKLAEAFDVPIALVSLVDDPSTVSPATAGLPEGPDVRQTSHGASIGADIMASNEVLAVEDVAKDERLARDAFFLEKGIHFYAGAPLRTASGFVLGALCVIDTKPRPFSDDDRKLLQSIADELMRKVESEARRKAEGSVEAGRERGADRGSRDIA